MIGLVYGKSGSFQGRRPNPRGPGQRTIRFPIVEYLARRATKRRQPFPRSHLEVLELALLQSLSKSPDPGTADDLIDGSYVECYTTMPTRRRMSLLTYS